MKNFIIIMLSLVLFTPLAYADKKHGGKTIEVKISLGTEDNQMAFVPEHCHIRTRQILQTGSKQSQPR